MNGPDELRQETAALRERISRLNAASVGLAVGGGRSGDSARAAAAGVAGSAG